MGEEYDEFVSEAIGRWVVGRRDVTCVFVGE